MALSSARRRESRADYWPGFVDAMATLLLVIIFLLSLFMLAQFFLSQELSGRDTALTRLNRQIAELTELLALERASATARSDEIAFLESSLEDLVEQRDELSTRLAGAEAAGVDADGEMSALRAALTEQENVSQAALARVDLLNQQLSALRRQIAALESALEVAESRDEESQARIADLGRRLNTALAQRVQELTRYRSDFFGRLSAILADRSDISVVGDRFVFQSEVLFPSGSATLNAGGRQDLSALAAELVALEAEIPDDIDWVLRVDGHTDRRPVSGTGRFESNWDLSAARAISVVQHLIEEGVPPERLVAAGFGEYRPIAEGDDEAAFARNRRIELKLTQR